MAGGEVGKLIEEKYKGNGSYCCISLHPDFTSAETISLITCLIVAECYTSTCFSSVPHEFILIMKPVEIY